MENKAVIVFLKAPEKGLVKTRLTRQYDEGFVLDLYKAFVLDTIDEAKGLANIHLFFWPPDKKNMIRQWMGEKFCLSPQSGQDLGEKMAHAFERIFSLGYEKAVLIGTDIPQLHRGILETAFLSLNQHDVVIGPSADSGYYLIGCCKKSYARPIFENIDWSTQKVMGQTREILERLKLTSAETVTLNDIDTPEDLDMLIEHINRDQYVGKRTREVLCRI